MGPALGTKGTFIRREECGWERPGWREPDPVLGESGLGCGAGQGEGVGWVEAEMKEVQPAEQHLPT